jgi:signal transduction histidine kinase/DNA-binding response OmpR family regulator
MSDAPWLAESTPSPENCLVGGGEMGALMRATDWSRTVFGPVSGWPQSLRTAISIMLESRFAMVVAWGPDFRFFYNDRYRPILGGKHPAALGTPCAEIFPEVWSVVGPEFERVAQGGAFAVDDWLLPLDRNGYLENCWFSLSYSPIRDESGGIGGLLAVVAETTGRVEGERRLATLRELARRASEATTPEGACVNASAVFEANNVDVPFALIYLLDREGSVARRVSAIGLPAEHPANIDRIELGSGRDDMWSLGDVVRSRMPAVLSDLTQRTAPLPGGPWPEHAHTAIVLPLARPGVQHAYGAIVAGVSPRRSLDDRYRGFFELAADHIATAISNAVSLDDARRRAEALAEIDRAKTAFFSNVSHEFRTPLTLMLGPLEDELRENPHASERLRIAHRNSVRLLKLVNTLLEFSRIEAGRVQAIYAPADIAALTRDLAGAFRSAIEHAGIRFEVQCDDIDAPVFLDRDMWEKIVLNLLSNALKFTFSGSIDLRLRRDGEVAELSVSDTGTGIPPAELPHVFERFHRVEGARARTHEGTGIGLALTHELVKLHGGTIAAQSTLDRGTRFTVRIPLGSAHLPPDRIGAAPAPAAPATVPFVAEAGRWLPANVAHADGTESPVAGETPEMSGSEAGGPERILVVDDNADMRDYMRQLLRGWDVSLAADGLQALERARADPPHLVVTDVMMPGLDGFGLLRELKADPRTQAVPVLMLSARAGEEARVSGLDAGADDYIIKPFSARELIARVGSLLKLSRARREADLQKQHLRSIFMQAPMPIVMLRGPEHVVELANPMTCRVWNRAEADVLNKPLLDVLPELREQPFKTLLDDVYRTGTPHVGKEAPARLDRRGDGAYETVYFNFVYTPLHDVDGGIDGVLVVAFDVTDEVTARNDMSELRIAAEAANRTKDQFLAMLSHELRNPLAPILTALQLMSLRGDQAHVKERTVIDRQVRHLVRLVDDLLDVSRIARGKIELREEAVELADIVAAAIESTSPLLEQRQHHVTVDVPGELWLRGDASRLTQIVVNVLTNAAKYTEPRGRIHIHARRDGDRLELGVRDSGIGISAEMMPHIFEMFAQERQALDRSHGGLGLGLTIVKSLVNMHGGTVEAVSCGVGEGSEFIIRLPAIPPASVAADLKPAATGESARTVTGRRILVVDDNTDAARLLAEALAMLGHDARVAFDGPDALAVAAEFQPHAALLDVGLPLMDGFELAERLLASAPAARRPVLVAVTGYGHVADRDRSRAAGFDAHVAKPVDVTHLVGLLERLFPQIPAN